MTKFSLGDIVASEMGLIMESEEHTHLFSKTAKKKEDRVEEKEDKKSDKKDKKEDAKKGKKDKKEDKKSDKKDKKSKKKEMTAESFKHLVNTLTKISHVLDESGLPQSSLITLEALDSIIGELAMTKFAKEKCCECDKECGKDCPCKDKDDDDCDCEACSDTNDVKAMDVVSPEHWNSAKLPFDVEAPSGSSAPKSLFDEISELDSDPNLLEVEDILSDPKAVDLINKDRGSQMLSYELSKPEYDVKSPFSSVDHEPLSLDEDLEDANDARLLQELGLHPLDEDPELDGVYSKKLSDAEKSLLSQIDSDGFDPDLLPTEIPMSEEDAVLPNAPTVPHIRDLDFGNEHDFSEKVSPTIPASKLSFFEEDSVKTAFDKLDNWMAKRAEPHNEAPAAEDEASANDLLFADDEEDFEDEE